MRFAPALAALAAMTFLASSAAAQPDAPPAPPPDPEPPPAAPEATPPTPAPPPPKTEAPAPEAPVARTEGLRLGLDLGYTRGTTARSDNVAAGTPSLLPLGLDLSLRTSKRVLLGLHGTAALGSRDDCLSSDHCTARDYTFGGHVEATFLEGRSIIPWFRYGISYEVLYHGGSVADGGSHQYRDALDILDARIGADYVLGRGEAGKTTRLGAYLGMITGVGVDRTGATGGGRNTGQDFTSAGHVWLGLGLRATLDP